MKQFSFSAWLMAAVLFFLFLPILPVHAEEGLGGCTAGGDSAGTGAPPVCIQEILAQDGCEVPQIRLTTQNGNGSKLQKKDGYTAAQVQIMDTAGNTMDLPCQVKVRGNTTSTVPKKSYTFKLEEKQNLFGMGKAKKWALLANCFDPTLLRTSIAFDLAKELQLPYTSEHTVTEVWMDGKYLGCYDLIEPVEVKSARVDIDTEGAKDFLLEYESKRVETDETYLEVGDWRFRVEEPESPTDAQKSHMRQVLKNAQDALKSGDYGRVENCLDTESFAKFYLVNEYFKTVDFGFSSVYFYCKDGKLYAGPVWDFDLSAGNVDPAYSVNYKKGVQPTGLYAAEKHFYVYLFKYDAFREKLSDIYFAHHTYIEQISASGGHIDSLAAQYDAVFKRNYADGGWKITTVYNELMRKPDATYEKNLDYLKNFLTERNAWLSEYYGVFDGCQPGDVNRDEKINASDAALILMAAAKLGGGNDDGLSAKQRFAANVNGDESINASDASLVLIYAAAVGAGQKDAVLVDMS